MLFAFICTDDPAEGLARRQANRPDHLAWLEGLGDKVKAAGPLMNDENSEPLGSLLIIECESLEAARALATEDPYGKAGVFEHVAVQPWKWLFGNPEEN